MNPAPTTICALLCTAAAAQEPSRPALPEQRIELRRGLLLHWACDEVRDVALDTSGHNHHGELDGARFERVDGHLALRFRGEEDRGDVARVANTAALSSPERTGALTIALWVKVRREPREFPVMVCKGGNERPTWGGYEFHLNTYPDNDLQFTSGSFTAVTHNAFGKWIDRRQGQWIHVAFSLARTGAAAFYVDGKSTGDTFLYGTDIHRALAKEDRALHVGGPDPRHHRNRAWFDGWMDELRIYDRALVPAEVAALFTNGR